MATKILLAMRGRPEELMLTGLQAHRTLTVTRRCADAAEVIAAALAGLGEVAVIDPDLGVDRSFCARLAQIGVHVIVLSPAVDHQALRSIGAVPVNAECDVSDQVEEVAALIAGFGGAGSAPPGATAGTAPPGATAGDAAAGGASASAPSANAAADGAASAEADLANLADLAGAREALAGGDPEGARARQLFPKIVAVLSPWGSPGRTSVATQLACEYARRGVDVLLIDASLWGSAVIQVLGLDPDAPGLAAAVRALERGSLDLSSLRRLLHRPADRLYVLGGLGRGTRWREVSTGAVPGLWEVATQWPGLVIVDGPVRIPESQDGFEGHGPHRNAIWDSLVEAADVACLVGTADTVGLERLVDFIIDWADVGTPGQVVVNRVRASAAGPRPADSVRDILSRYAGVDDPVLIVEDPLAMDAATLRGGSLAEVAPRSAARLGIIDLSHRLHPHRPGRRRPRGWLRKRAAIVDT